MSQCIPSWNNIYICPCMHAGNTQSIPIRISNLGTTSSVVMTLGEHVSKVQKERERVVSDIHCTDPPEKIVSTTRLCRTLDGVNTPATSPGWTYTAAFSSAARYLRRLSRLPTGRPASTTTGNDATRVKVCDEDGVRLHT